MLQISRISIYFVQLQASINLLLVEEREHLGKARRFGSKKFRNRLVFCIPYSEDWNLWNQFHINYKEIPVFKN